MRYLNNIWYVLLLCGLLSCEKIIDYELEDAESFMVANAILQPDSTIKVHVSRSSHILEKDTLYYLEDAMVEVSCSNGQSEILYYDKYGLYKSTSLTATVGFEYKLRTSHCKFEEIHSNVVIPSPVPVKIEDVNSIITKTELHSWKEQINTPDSFIFVDRTDTLTFVDVIVNSIINDPPEVKNYYKIEMWSLLTYFNPNDSNDITFSAINFINSNFALMDLIENRGLEVMNQEDKNGSAFYFSDNTFNGKQIQVQLKHPDLYLGGLLTAVKVNLYNISEDYYKYLLSVAHSLDKSDDAYAEKVKIYSNIENGQGIFGSTACYKDVIVFDSLLLDKANEGLLDHF